MATSKSSRISTEVSFEGQLSRLQILIPICPYCKANFASGLDDEGRLTLCRQCSALAEVSRKRLEEVS